MFSTPQTAPLGSCFKRSSGPGKPTEKVLHYQTLHRWSKTKEWKCYWLQQVPHQPLAADPPAPAFRDTLVSLILSSIKCELKKIAAVVPHAVSLEILPSVQPHFYSIKFSIKNASQVEKGKTFILPFFSELQWLTKGTTFFHLQNLKEIQWSQSQPDT